MNFACYITFLLTEGNISSLIRYSYLSILPDDNADFFYDSLLISYCSFSSLFSSSIVMVSFYIFSKMFVLRRKRLSDAKVVSITKKEYGFVVHFL